MCHLLGQTTETEHTQRVGDLGQRRALLCQRCAIILAGAHKNIDGVFDVRQILTNGRTNGLHEFDAGRVERGGRCFPAFAVGGRAQRFKTVGLTNCRDPRTVGGRAPDVIQQIVQERFTDLALVLRILAARGQKFDLAIALPQQSFDGRTGPQSALDNRLDDTAEHPPGLKHQRRTRVGFKLCGHTQQGLQLLVGLDATQPAEQRRLIRRAEFVREHADINFGRRRRTLRHHARAVGIEHEQRAF